MKKLYNTNCSCQLSKKCIFERIKYCTEVIKQKIIFDKIYGFVLLNYIFDKVDEFFAEYNYNDRDTIIMRIYDNIERNKIK